MVRFFSLLGVESKQADNCSADEDDHMHPKNGEDDDDDLGNMLGDVDRIQSYLQDHRPRKWEEESFDAAMTELRNAGIATEQYIEQFEEHTEQRHARMERKRLRRERKAERRRAAGRHDEL